MLVQFKTIAPELYAEIDTIRDRLGRPVNVYVKFVAVDGTDVKAEGTRRTGVKILWSYDTPTIAGSITVVSSLSIQTVPGLSQKLKQ